MAARDDSTNIPRMSHPHPFVAAHAPHVATGSDGLPSDTTFRWIIAVVAVGAAYVLIPSDPKASATALLARINKPSRYLPPSAR